MSAFSSALADSVFPAVLFIGPAVRHLCVSDRRLWSGVLHRHRLV